MQLCAILTKDDLTSVVGQLTPLRVAISPRRIVTLGRPAKIELIAGAGLRVRGDARFTWDVGGLTIPVTLRSWQIMLVPSFVFRDGGHVLAFDPILEDLDFKGLPMFLDGRVAQAVKDGLAAQRNELFWNFEQHLSVLRSLPNKISPAGEVKLAPTGGSVSVTATDVRFTFDFAFTMTREAAPPSLRQAALEMAAPSSRRAVAAR